MGTHGAFVPLDKSWEVSEAIMTTFRDFGYRYNPRTKCRSLIQMHAYMHACMRATYMHKGPGHCGVSERA